jgi:hypothetical protein
MDAIPQHGLRLIQSKTVELDDKVVKQFAGMTPSIVERPLDEGRVDYLAARLAEGTAIPFIWSYVTHDGKDYRMNGQHSSIMLERLNGNLPAGLVAHIDQYEVETEAEMVNIFRQYDARKSGRSPLDVTNAYASVVPGLKNIPRDVLKLGAEGINWSHITVDRLPAKKADDRYEALMEPQNLAFLQWMGHIYSIKTPELRQLPVVAAMYKTYFVDVDKANEFWSSVARGGDEYNEQDAARQIDSWLRLLKDKSSKLDVRPPSIYQACIFAWNAFIDGKPVIKIAHDTKKGLHDPKYPA